MVEDLQYMVVHYIGRYRRYAKFFSSSNHKRC
jgi:hypothetical protein